jgi:Tol biopolymer transport system component
MARPRRPTTTQEPNASTGTQPLSPAPDRHATNGSGNGTGPRRRGRPRKNAVAAQPQATPRRATAPPVPATVRQQRDTLTVEQIVAIESPREFRLHPRGTAVAYVAEAAGARQLFVLSLRAGVPRQVTASEKPIGDPQWSPDGRRIAYTRDDAVWIVEADGSRPTLVNGHPAGTSAPRWSPDGRTLAFLSRRRGWSQVWLVDAPIPRRGRPATNPRPPEPRALTKAAFDVERFEWSPNGAMIAIAGQGAETVLTSQILLVDVASGREQTTGADPSWETAPRWMPDGSLLYASDADGWFQVIRRAPDGGRSVLTTGNREHGEPSGDPGGAPLASPDGSRFTYPEFRDGFVDLLVATIAARPPPRACRSIRGRASGGQSAGVRTARGSRPLARTRHDRRTCGCCRFPATPPTARGRGR